MIEIIKATFFAGEVKTFLMQGEYVEILEADYPIDVAMMDRSGAQLSTMRNAEASYFSRPGKYEVIQVTSSEAQTVRLFVGSGDAGTRRTSGDVSVIDGEKSRAMAGGAFVGSANTTALANQYPFCQLWNPANSGKNLVVNKVYVGSPSGMLMAVTKNTNALVSDLTASNAGSKKLGGAVGVGEIRAESNAVPVTQVLRQIYVIAVQTTMWEPKGGVIVPPGFGLIVMGQAQAVTLVTDFEWFEEQI